MERQNTEPLFNAEEFSELITDTSFSDKLGNGDIIDILDINNSPSKFLTSSYASCKQEMEPWFNIDHITRADSICDQGIMLQDVSLPKRLLQADDSDEDEDIRLPSLGFESWAGPLNFNIGFKTKKFSSSKWCYNSDTNKLYIMRNASVPVEISMDTWKNCTLNITPVFLKSQYISEPVLRCHNHRIADENRGFPNPMHIVEVLNPTAQHKLIGERYSVELPLGRPAPGENSKVIHLKSRCWNTCVGAERRGYCVIFTLFASDGREIGRQVLNYKSCQSPIRDMGTDLKKFGKAVQAKRKVKSKELRIAKPSTAQPIAAKEPIGMESLLVLSDIAPDVKKYINCLMAGRFANKDKNFTKPYPEV